jgi:hypothetical protein
MRLHIGIVAALLFSGAAFGQNRFGTPTSFSFGTPVLTGGFPNAVFPAGTPANSPNITRFNSNAVFPAGGGPRLVIPGKRPNRFTGSPIVAVPYAFPVYVGGSGFDNSYAQPAPQQPQQPNVTVVFPPQAAPVIVPQYGQGDASAQFGPNAPVPGPQSLYQPEPTEQPSNDQSSIDHFLIALKDHTVYSVVAYWVDGDTLHYFTAGNVHNQVSLSLVDHSLTERLNRESGAEVKLPDDK